MWAITWAGNFMGCAIFVGLICATGVFEGRDAYMQLIAVKKTHHSFGNTLVRAVFANWLVGIATWQANAAQDMMGKAIAIWCECGTPTGDAHGVGMGWGPGGCPDGGNARTQAPPWLPFAAPDELLPARPSWPHPPLRCRARCVPAPRRAAPHNTQHTHRLPISAFAMFGWEHVIANMYLFPVAIALGSDISAYDVVVSNFIPATIGNWVRRLRRRACWGRAPRLRGSGWGHGVGWQEGAAGQGGCGSAKRTYMVADRRGRGDRVCVSAGERWPDLRTGPPHTGCLACRSAAPSALRPCTPLRLARPTSGSAPG